MPRGRPRSISLTDVIRGAFERDVPARDDVISGTTPGGRGRHLLHRRRRGETVDVRWHRIRQIFESQPYVKAVRSTGSLFCSLDMGEQNNDANSAIS